MTAGTNFPAGRHHPPGRGSPAADTRDGREEEGIRPTPVLRPSGQRGASGTRRPILSGESSGSPRPPGHRQVTQGAGTTSASDGLCWVLAAKALGRKTVALRARAGETRWATSILTEDVASASEAYLLGLAAGVDALSSRGAPEIRVLVTDPLLEGFLRRGWSPRSARIVWALGGFVRAARRTTLSFVLLKSRS